METKIENKIVRLDRIGGSWGYENLERKMTFLEAINWLNRHHYTLRWARNCIDGYRRMTFSKKDCNTEYQMILPL